MRIRDIATIASCTLPKQDTVWLLNLDAVEQQTGKVIEYKYVSPDMLTGSTTAFDTNIVLYSKLRPNLNKVVVPAMSGYATSEMLPLRPDPQKCTREYLAFYLRSNAFVEWAISKTNGAKMPRLGTKDLLDKEIPLPSIPTQKHIVAVFVCVESLIDELSRMLSHFDELVKSRFIEMFGDPVRNDKGWPLAPLASLAEIKIGPFGSLLHKEDYVHGGHALVNPSHIIEGQIVTDDDLTVSEAKYAEMEAYHLHTGDIVLGRRGEMGRCAVVYNDGLLCGTGSLIIRPASEMLPYFLQKIISYPTFKEAIEDMAVGVTMMNLNVPIVSNFMIPMLPLDEQSAYLRFVEQTDKSKFSLKNGGKEVYFAVKYIWESLCRGAPT